MNPYDPQRPSDPKSFAGRETLVGRVEEHLEAARRSGRSGAVLVHGHRGSGKTSALRKIEALAEQYGRSAVVVEIPLHESSSQSKLLRSVVDELHSFARRRRDGGPRWKTLVSRLASVQVSVLGTSVGLAGRKAPEPVTPLGAWREALDVLRGVGLVAICIDDAEQLDATGMGTLKTIAEAQTPVPVLLAVAAGPEFLARLATRAFSPVARAFTGATFDMEAFTLEETRDALQGPLTLARAPASWEDGAVRRLHEWSRGYPYLVKCLAHATYRDGARLNSADVDAAVPRALELAAPWLDREIPRASAGDIRAFARLVRTDRNAWSSSEILARGINSVYIQRLVRLGVLRRSAPGRYELRKAPVIALYHELRRGLVDRSPSPPI